MKKKNIYILAMLLLMTSVFSGCTDWLTMKPESQIILDDYWQSQSDVESVIAACYRGLTDDATIYRMIVWGELRSDNLTAGSPFAYAHIDMQHILNGELTSVNQYASWAPFYTVINYCNTVLHFSPTVLSRDRNFTPAELKRVQAEVLTIRSLCYFYLVRSFGDVPWMGAASVDDTQNYTPAKSPERAVMDSIISNLLTAQQYARADYGRTDYNKGRITLDAVNALLADVYLWDQQYDKCVSTCNLVIADKNLSLVDANLMYRKVFYLGNSSESIFELNFNDKVQVNNPVNQLYGNVGNNSGELSFPTTLGYDPYGMVPSIYSPFDYKVSNSVTESQYDIRAKDFINTNMANQTGQNSIFKYAGLARVENSAGTSSSYLYRTNTANWIIYRLSDVILMKAEALVELDGESNFASAMKCVDQTYLRSNVGQDSLYLKDYDSKPQMESLVLRERQRELMFEGKRWYDLMRVARRENSVTTINSFVNHKVSGNGAAVSALVMDALYMPIALSELQVNPNLKQNPYYEQTTSYSKN
jgi:hypothetical protein